VVLGDAIDQIRRHLRVAGYVFPNNVTATYLKTVDEH
jgi:hypothetical protein